MRKNGLFSITARIVKVSLQSLLVGLITCVFLELFVCPRNMPDLARLFRPSADPRLVFEMSPGTSIKFSGVLHDLDPTSIHINKTGFRGADFETDLRRVHKRLLAVGDSYTFGLGVEESQAWPSRLELLLNSGAHRSGQRSEVLNLGVPGYNIGQVVETLEKHLDLKPDAVLVLFPMNDIRREFWFPAGPAMKILRYSRLVATLITLYNAAWTEVAWRVSSRYRQERMKASEPALERLAALGKTRGFKIGVFYIGHPDFNDIFAWLGRQCQALGLHLEFVQTRRNLTDTSLLLRDGHLNAAGYDVVARTMEHYARRSIEPRE